MHFRPTRVEIDLGAIGRNLGAVRKSIGEEVKILAVVKADAYGHGAVPVARKLVTGGVEMLGVATLEEAIELREAGIHTPILMLNAISPREAEVCLDHDITQALVSPEIARVLEQAASERGKRASGHIKIDTGMGRVGCYWEEAVSFVEGIGKLSNLEVKGIYTHLACADAKDRTSTLQQLASFRGVLDLLGKKGISFPLVHAANSAGILSCRESLFSLVRPGLMLYGYYSSPEVPRTISLEGSLRLRTEIVFLKEVPAGRSISYGATYRTREKTCIATLPIGYGDGYSRGLSNRAEVLVRGKRAPLVGRVCMDQCMIDVGRIPGVMLGDEVVLIGKQRDQEIKVEEVAGWMGTIPNEVVCLLGKRIPRTYRE